MTTALHNRIDGVDPLPAAAVFPNDQVAALEAMHQRFLSDWGREVSEYLDMPVAGRCAASETLTIAALLEETREEGWLGSIGFGSDLGYLLIWLPPSLIFRVLRSLIGAPPDTPSDTRASLTDIELHVLQPFLDLFAKHLRRAWAASPASLGSLEMVSNAPGNELAQNQSAALVLRSELTFENGTEAFAVCVPGLAVRVGCSSRRAGAESKPVMRQDLQQIIRGARVQVEAVLPGAGLRLRDLLGIEPGHLLEVGRPVDTPLECRINGIAKFRGELVESAGRGALLLTAPVLIGG